ncbi:hypothetical protein [Qipengyuania pelagi]|nr:hypothetical protein [Qipengyuania pelagi]
MIPTAAIATSDAPKDRVVALLNWNRMSIPLGCLKIADENARAAPPDEVD